MTAVQPTPREAVTGDYYGRPTHRLENEHVWLEVLAEAGPRIVKLGLAGSTQNLLAETPDETWVRPLGLYELLGGHRLWFAPEDPERVAVPDSLGLDLTLDGDGVRLAGLPEPSTGLQRSTVVHLVPDRAVVEIRDELRNIGERVLELAPWSITQLPAGGVVRLPQPPAIEDHVVTPNRILVLWPYTSWADPRLDLRDGEVRVLPGPGPWLKIGSFIEAGWLSYARDGVTLVCQFPADPAAVYPDRGCNAEIYAGEAFMELEVLGPMTRLAPGETIALKQRWELTRTPALDAA